MCVCATAIEHCHEAGIHEFRFLACCRNSCRMASMVFRRVSGLGQNSAPERRKRICLCRRSRWKFPGAPERASGALWRWQANRPVPFSVQNIYIYIVSVCVCVCVCVCGCLSVCVVSIVVGKYQGTSAQVVSDSPVLTLQGSGTRATPPTTLRRARRVVLCRWQAI